MRRVIALALASLATTLAVTGLPGCARSGGSDDSYKVDAVFDAAKGIFPGNIVQVAGAKVGTIDNVVLTKGYQARIEMTVERRFAPFHADARCQIRPIALIGEMAVNCDPGTPRGPILASGPGGRPTVPVTRTTVPVDLSDVFAIWQAPVTQRLSILVSALGAGVAGRGADLNRILQRTNPALLLAHDTIAAINQERRNLTGLVESSDRLLAGLAPQREAVQTFLDQVSRVLSRTAQHRGPLGESIRRLPPLLAAMRPALAQVDVVAEQTAPILRDLHDAAPSINRVVAGITPLSTVARPALQRIGAAAVQGRRQLPALTPAIRQLASFARDAKPVARLLNSFATSLRERGFVENFNSTVYRLASFYSRFSGSRHMGAALFLSTACAGSSNTGLTECSGKFNPESRTRNSGSRTRNSGSRTRNPESRTRDSGTKPAPAPAPAPARRPAIPEVPQLTPDVPDAVTALLDFLLK